MKEKPKRKLWKHRIRHIFNILIVLAVIPLWIIVFILDFYVASYSLVGFIIGGFLEAMMIIDYGKHTWDIPSMLFKKMLEMTKPK